MGFAYFSCCGSFGELGVFRFCGWLAFCYVDCLHFTLLVLCPVLSDLDDAHIKFQYFYNPSKVFGHQRNPQQNYLQRQKFCVCVRLFHFIFGRI